MKSTYEAKINHFSTDKETWEYESNNNSFTGSVPKEFGGSGEGYTPEHLYTLSLLNCYIASLQVIASKSNMDLRASADIEVTLETDKNPPLQEGMIRLKTDTKPRRLKSVAKKALQHCYIHQSVKTKLTIDVNHEEL